MARAHVGEIELSYERAGDGPPLLLIMGMSGTARHWGEPFLGPLRESFEVITYDHRGVGRSTPLEGELSISQMAEDAAGLLGALEIDSAHVLGISMGGMIAQELALAHPEQIRTLALGCTYCGGEGSAHTTPEVAQRLFEAMSSGDRPRALRAAWEANVSPAFAADEAAYTAFVEIGTVNAVALPVIMAQMQAIFAHDTHARLGSLRMDTLVIHGTVDQMLPVQNGRLVASLIPDSQLEILDGIGHMFFWELPERSAELVRTHAGIGA
jgi:pimeloyl-ACP methyl ester carboxylesterase